MEEAENKSLQASGELQAAQEFDAPLKDVACLVVSSAPLPLTYPGRTETSIHLWLYPRNWQLLAHWVERAVRRIPRPLKGLWQRAHMKGAALGETEKELQTSSHPAVIVVVG